MLISRKLLETLIDLSDHSAVALGELMDDLGLEVKSREDLDGDSVYNLETLANRGDHASHHGVATELSGRLLRPVRLPEIAELPAAPAGIPVRVTTRLCPRYTLLELPELRAAPTDATMAVLLRRLGADLYNRAADVTNFVNLELGQPMHAFDRDLVTGEVRIEELASEAEVLALDGKTYRLPARSIVIADAEKIIAVAGVIGCMNSRVTDATRGVLLESAVFDPVQVRVTARAMRISTRASFRFERGADLAMAVLAQRRALRLLAAHAAGFTDVHAAPPEPRLVALRLPRLTYELGCDLGRATVERHLAFLGFRLARAEGDTLFLEVPPHRLWDVESEQDLVEEVAKARGYNELPEVMPAILPGSTVRTARDQLEERAQAVLIAAGFHEVIAPALHGPELSEGLPVPEAHALGRFVTTINSLESAFSTLRNNAVTVLCRILRENQARGVDDLKVFELGVVFHPDPACETGVAERWILSAAATGRWSHDVWRDRREADFFLMKGVVETLGEALGASFEFVPSEHPLLQPFARADVLIAGEVVGHVGRVHPEAAGELEGGAVYLEVALEPLVPLVERLPSYHEPSSFPPSARDITWVVPDESSGGVAGGAVVASTAVERVMRAAAGPLLREVRLRDLYRPRDGHSKLTWRLVFQSSERTLRREEVEAAVERVASEVAAKLGLARG